MTSNDVGRSLEEKIFRSVALTVDCRLIVSPDSVPDCEQNYRLCCPAFRRLPRRISKHEYGIETAGTIPLNAILSYNMITMT